MSTSDYVLDAVFENKETASSEMGILWKQEGKKNGAH